MPVWVVVGGQYGSEGKGKIAALLARDIRAKAVVRCGGPNSGHTVQVDSRTVVLRQLPTSVIWPGVRLLVPAGGLIDLRVLFQEMEKYDVAPDRIGVDRNAYIIQAQDVENERQLRLHEAISSTGVGVGAAVARRALRGSRESLAQEVACTEPRLAALLTDVAAEIATHDDAGEAVIIEGTQGFGLSLYHTASYPHATSRDTTAAGFLSEAGCSPRRVTEIVQVLRTYPIRVAGVQAGPLEDELTWEEIQAESGAPASISEYTTVTGRLRRVGRFEWPLVERATLINQPTQLAVTGLDHLTYTDRQARGEEHLSARSREFLTDLQARLRTPIAYASVGPDLTETIRALGAIRTGADNGERYESSAVRP